MGNEGQGQLQPYLDGCIAFARQAAHGGQAVRPAAVEFRWRDHPGGQFLQRRHPPPPEETFPRPWKEGWQGTTLAPRVYLEWGSGSSGPT